MARGRDHVAHRHPSSIAAVKLEALHEPRIGEPLEPSLRRGRSPPWVESAMQLAGEHVLQLGDQRENREVQWIGLELA